VIDLSSVACIHVDVFSEKKLFGNPLAVFVLPEDPHQCMQASLQRIANWINLSESTFVQALSSQEYRVRIFTPFSELPFAGHPSLGTAAALAALQLLDTKHQSFTQHCDAGALPMTYADQRWFVQAPAAKIQTLSELARQELEDACGQNTGDYPVAVVDNGPHWAVAEFSSAEQLLSMRPNLSRLADWNRRYNNLGLAAFARDDLSPQGLEVRCFVPIDGIAEDPVTGSGNAAIAAFLHHFKAFKKLSRTYQARQGRAIGRDGFLQMRVNDRGVVQIGGRAQIVMQGTIDLSECIQRV
jgi:PhzF family phenazine biosynthesis protein